MQGRLEKDIEDDAVDRILRRWPGTQQRKMNGPGARDWPDRMFLFDGALTVFIEFKRPGKPLRKGQAYIQLLLRMLGFEAHAASSVAGAVAICEKAIKRHRARCT